MTEVLDCECGIYIAGRTMNHAKGNLEQHKKTEQHRTQLARKKVSVLAFVGGSIMINEDGDYYIESGYDGVHIRELRKELAKINYDKNDDGE